MRVESSEHLTRPRSEKSCTAVVVGYGVRKGTVQLLWFYFAEETAEMLTLCTMACFFSTNMAMSMLTGF